jgi:hypothetical protein
MSSNQPVRYFSILLVTILALAGILRFTALDAASLNEYEASAALNALHPGQSLGEQPGYTVLTSLLFSLLGTGDAIARFWPVVFGLALVALPVLWRDRLGDKAVLVLALILAIDPGMVALSRLSSGRMIAISAALIALTAWRLHRPHAAGVMAAVAALASGTLVFGILAGLLTWLVLRPKLNFDRGALRTAGLAALVTLVAGGTLLFTMPQGLGGLGLSLQGFVASAQPAASIATVLFALLGYGLPLLIFGGAAAIGAWQRNDLEGKLLSLFAVFALALVLIHPGRQVADLAWVLLPLAVLSAQQISRFLHAPQQEPAAAYGGLGLLLLLSTFFVFTLARTADEAQLILPITGGTLPWIAPGLWVGLFVLLVAGVVVVLIALGWSVTASKQALVWTSALLFATFLLSASSRFMYAAPLANDFWSPGPAAGSLQLMQKTLNDISFWQQGQGNSVAVDLRRESAALQWALRDLPAFEATGTPSLAVTSGEAQPQEFASYRGQSFALSSQPAWAGWPPNYFAWLLFRKAPVQTEQVILWVSPDIFLDDGVTQTP